MMRIFSNHTGGDWSPIPTEIWSFLDRIFDDEWYRMSNPDIKSRRRSPRDHYRRYGYLEGRSPGPFFDPTWYRRTCPIGLDSSIPTILHWLTCQADQRGEPNPLFESRWIQAMSSTQSHPLDAYFDDPSLDPSPLFDTQWFLEQHPAGSTRSPLEEYLTSEPLVSPCPLFDPVFYAQRFPDASRPLEHYITVGGCRGAAPNATLDGLAYIHGAPWILTGNESPLLHFVKYGLTERTPWTPLGTIELIRDLLDGSEFAAARFLLRRLNEAVSKRRHSAAHTSSILPFPDALISDVHVSPSVIHDAVSGVIYLQSSGLHSARSVVSGRIDGVVIAYPYASIRLEADAALAATGSPLDDVACALSAAGPTIVRADYFDDRMVDLSTTHDGAAPIPLAEDAWVHVNGKLEIVRTLRPDVLVHPIQAAATVRASTALRLARSLDPDLAEGVSISWPLQDAAAAATLAACTSLDVDGDIPTSVLLLTPSCADVAVRTSRGLSDHAWSIGCARRGISCTWAPSTGGKRTSQSTLTVGVVIPTYNHAGWISQAIESFLNQDQPVAEIVIVDDASTDDTAEIVSRYAQEGVRYERIERSGAGAAINVGVELLTTDVVAFLGSDDTALPNRVEHDLWFLNDPDLSAVASLPVIIDEDGHLRSDAAAPFLFPDDKPARPVDVLRLLWRDGNFICNPAVSMRREAYWRYGASPPSLIHLHDFMLWVRLAGNLRLACSTERTTEYRRTRQAQSLSSPSDNGRLRSELEWTFDRFFDNCTPKAFEVAFGESLPPERQSAPIPAVDSIPLYFDHQFAFVRRRGHQKAIAALEDPRLRKILRDAYGLTEQRVFEIGESVDIDGASDIKRLFSVMRQRDPWHVPN